MHPFGEALGVEIVTAGGETADVGDLVQTVIVDSTVFARLPRADVVDCSHISAGDAIVGLSSVGRASYEDTVNSGMGSNGLTAARHVMLHTSYGEAYPETFSSTLAAEHVYGGKYRLEDPLPDSELTVGEALLSPTRTYAPVIRDLLAAHRDRVTGLIHCTGGGQAKCLGFGKDLHYVKRDLFPTPPLFRAIQAEGKVASREMYEMFNMGHRMEVYCDPQIADAVADLARGYGIEAHVVGEVLPTSKPGKNQLTITHEGTEIAYER